MSDIHDEIDDAQGLSAALEVARGGCRGGCRPALRDEVAKVLSFMLRDGECDAWVRVPHIDIRFSWLQRKKPSSYFGRLAPGLVGKLLDFGGVEAINDEMIFQIQPSECSSGLYKFSFDRKWVLVKLEEGQIIVRIRSGKRSLDQALEPFGA